MNFPLYAHHETSIGFFLGDTSIHTKNHDTKITKYNNEKVFLFGLSAHCKETMGSKGHYNTFTIEFKPNGFTSIFGIPASKISNNIFAANEVIGSSVSGLYEKLLDASDAQQMVRLADNFLMKAIKHKKASYVNDGISKISDHLLTFNKVSTVRKYAYEANMSLRNFERIFLEQIGVSPKLFCRLVRFNSAFKYKISRPETGWAGIASEFGYFDTMHLIKEFKQFTNASPAILINENSDFLENSCYKIQPILNN